MAIRRKHIRTLTEKLLFEQKISKPAVPVEKLIRNLGIQLRIDPVEDSLSGFLVRRADNGSAVIGVNANHHAARRRFTMAHELGHFLLHEGETVHFDSARPGYSVNLRNRESSLANNEIEIEANLFAAELLMPATFLEAAIQKMERLDLLEEPRVLKQLADTFSVSVQALTIRLQYIGLVHH